MAEIGTATRILAVLRDSDRALALHEVAGAVGLSSPAVLRHLVQLADEGLVNRNGQAKSTTYRAVARVAVQWQARVRDPMASEERWLALDWRSRGIDWRFPLLSRIADASAYDTLLRFLQLADVRGQLHPWLKPVPVKSQDRRTTMRYRDYLRRLSDSRQAEGISFVVFGSSARGDVRPESDVDLAIIGPAEGLEGPEEEHAEFLQWFGYEDLASEVNMGSPRGLGVLLMTWNELRHMPNVMMRDAILRDAVTVYSTSGYSGFAEAMRV